MLYDKAYPELGLINHLSKTSNIMLGVFAFIISINKYN